METGLKNRVALLGASSQGIGHAAAEKFAAEGARLAMCGRNETRLANAAEQLRGRYGVEDVERAIVTLELEVHLESPRFQIE